MSTKNLARTVIEGGRYRGNAERRRSSNGQERTAAHQTSTLLRDRLDADAVVYAPRTPVRRSFDDKLGAANRWLGAQVGRPWNKVRSELCARFDARTTAGRHILFDHLLQSGLVSRAFARDLGAARGTGDSSVTHSTINGDLVRIRVWTPIHELESDAIRQLKAVASLPWVAHHVAVMPDVHVGKGATVGSVIALRGAVAPAFARRGPAHEPNTGQKELQLAGFGASDQRRRVPQRSRRDRRSAKCGAGRARVRPAGNSFATRDHFGGALAVRNSNLQFKVRFQLLRPCRRGIAAQPNPRKCCGLTQCAPNRETRVT
jgi:tRNA-splicing ligase RtcB